MLPRLIPYLAYAGLGGLGLAAGSTAWGWQQSAVLARDPDTEEQVAVAERVPSRAQQLARLRNNSSEHPFDLLVIGGGATGTGVAVDAASRGLKTALVEHGDFASGTSSRSTKLVHGGVRYLEKAVFNLDYGQLKLVYEALHERKVLLEIAPHLAHTLAIIMPCYKWWEVPYFWAGLKAYDVVAGSQNLAWSKFTTAAESRRRIPTLAQHRSDGATLMGSIMYYDGQFDDARMNVSLACTAAALGATAVNYAPARKLIKNAEGKVVGATCRDTVTGEDVDVYARVVVNATGPFADSVRRLSQGAEGTTDCVQPSSGAHVTLPAFYGAPSTGLIVPKTKDGRIVFMLPWLGHVIAGTTDVATKVTFSPKPSEEEITFILDTISDHLQAQVRRSDVLSAWSGIRPLAANPNESNTSNVLRDHVIFEEPDGLITVTGGKWTTYRLMAQDAVDAALATGRLPMARPCSTAGLKLVGAQRYHEMLFAEIAQQWSRLTNGAQALSSASAQHLASAYGDRAFEVLRIAHERKLGSCLAVGHPMLEAEVLYCTRHEYCQTVEDFVARRTRLAFLDTRACSAALPRVAELMAAELGWTERRKKQEVESAQAFLRTFA